MLIELAVVGRVGLLLSSLNCLMLSCEGLSSSFVKFTLVERPFCRLT